MSENPAIIDVSKNPTDIHSLVRSNNEMDDSIRSADSNNLVSDIYIGTAEKTVYESSMHPDSLDSPFNPDDLVEKDTTYKIYEDMMQDDQVNVSMQLKKDVVLGEGFDIIAQEEGQEEIVKSLRKSLIEDPEIPFSESLSEMLSAYEFGFSLTEKVFKKKSNGELTLKYLKPRHPASWLIHTDKKGNVEKYEQLGISESIEVDPDSLIHYVNNRKFQNPYGISDLRATYYAWFTKRQIIRYYAIFLEKAASPIPIARFDKNVPSGTRDKIFNAIKKFQTKTALAIPKEIEIEFLQASTNGEAYTKALDMLNMFIGRSLSVPDTIGFQGSDTSQGGSMAMAREHTEMFLRHVAKRRDQLEALINYHIVQPLVAWNFGHVENMPRFELNPIKEDDDDKAARLWLEGVKTNTWKPTIAEVNHFQEIVNFPKSDEDSLTKPMEPIQDDIFEEIPKDETTNNGNGNDNNPIDNSSTEIKEFAKVFKPVDSEFGKRTDTEAIEKQLNTTQFRINNEVGLLIREMKEDIIDQIVKKKILSGQKFDRISDIKIKNLKKIKQILNRNLRDNFKESKKIAANELIRANTARKFIEPALPSSAFMDLLEKESFQFVGDWEHNIKKDLNVRLTAAIKDGENLSSVVNSDIFTTITSESPKIRIERYARTKATEVLNRARIEHFEETGIVAGYEYSAILDDRTTDICAGLHGKKFKSGNQPIPPLHFNCRSTLIPITMFEDFKPDSKVGGEVETKSGKKVKIKNQDIEKFIENEKGKGFAKQ